MGKKRTTVGTSVSRAISDDYLPNAVQTGILKSILASDTDPDASVVDYIQEELINSLGVRAENMYDYCKQGYYLYGLPSGQFVTGATGIDVLTAQLATIEGVDVQVDYAHYGVANDLHVGWMHLMSEQGYDPATNELGVLTAAKGTPVYLDDMVVVVPASQADSSEAESLEQWGVAARAGYTPERTTGTTATRALLMPSLIQKETEGTTEHLLVKTIWKTSAGLQRDSFTIPITGYSSNDNYWHARYLVGGVVKYWMYLDGSGMYPTLDKVYATTHSDAGSFFPFIYFRFGKVSEISDKTTDSYKAGKKLCSKLNLTYDDIAEAIDENDDIAEIEQAMLMMMVPANTENSLERQYLFSFFDNLYLSDEYSGHRYTSAAAAALAGGEFLTPSLVIQDKRFKLSVDFSAIYKRRVAGSLGSIGTYDSGYEESSTSQTVVDTSTGEESTIVTPSKHHYYRQQVSTGFYDEILVYDLKTVFWILGDFKQATGEGDADILMIPIDRSISEAYSIPVRETLYARSLYYVFNSAVVTHLKWYQTEIFTDVLIVVAIIITIWSWGTLGAQAWALVAAGMYTAAAILVIMTLLEYLVVYLAMKLFVRVVGVKIAFIVAIVAAVAGMAGAIQAGGVAGAPWAGQLMAMSSGLTSAVSSKYKSMTADLANEASDIQDWEDSASELLEAAQDVLGGDVHLSPFVIFGESPQDYYNRTIHSGNIGVIGVDAVSSYVDVALTLPKLATSSVEGMGYEF